MSILLGVMAMKILYRPMFSHMAGLMNIEKLHSQQLKLF